MAWPLKREKVVALRMTVTGDDRYDKDKCGHQGLLAKALSMRSIRLPRHLMSLVPGLFLMVAMGVRATGLLPCVVRRTRCAGVQDGNSISWLSSNIAFVLLLEVC